LNAVSEKQEEMAIQLEQSPLAIKDLYERVLVPLDFRQKNSLKKQLTVPG
jgi:hypothetical protein